MHSSFDKHLSEFGLAPLQPTDIEILQANLGKMGNPVCCSCSTRWATAKMSPSFTHKKIEGGFHYVQS